MYCSPDATRFENVYHGNIVMCMACVEGVKAGGGEAKEPMIGEAVGACSMSGVGEADNGEEPHVQTHHIPICPHGWSLATILLYIAGAVRMRPETMQPYAKRRCDTDRWNVRPAQWACGSNTVALRMEWTIGRVLDNKGKQRPCMPICIR